MLDLTVDEAARFFRNVPTISDRLIALEDVGLGYVKLGQSATTLSGGEAQRVKLATELAKKSDRRTIYILDEPTTGLHFADIHKLLEVLMKLRDSGNTLIVIEHNLEVIKCADWVVISVPEGGEGGGRIVGEGRRNSSPALIRVTRDVTSSVCYHDFWIEKKHLSFAFCGPGGIHALVAISRLNAAAEKAVVKLANDARYIQALQALDEGIPQVSIQKLTECLAAKLSPDDRALATFQLARAFLSADRSEDVLKTLSRLPPTYDASANLLKAQAFAALGRWADAYPIYHQLGLQNDAPLVCRIGEAECLQALGRTKEAINLLEQVAGGKEGTTAVRLRARE